MIKQNIALTHIKKQKQLLMKIILMTYLNQSILQLYQTNKEFQEKVQAGSLIQSQIKILIFQNTIPQLVQVT